MSPFCAALHFPGDLYPAQDRRTKQGPSRWPILALSQPHLNTKSARGPQE